MQPQNASASDAHCLYREITNPTSIIHSLRLSFLSPCGQNLIVIKAGLLEIYCIDSEAGTPLSVQNLTTAVQTGQYLDQNGQGPPIRVERIGQHLTPYDPMADGSLYGMPSLPSSTVLNEALVGNNAIVPILTLHTSVKLYGNVIGLDTIHFNEQLTESLCLLFDDNSLSIVHWDPVTLCVCTIFVHNAELRDMNTPHSENSVKNQKQLTADTLTIHSRDPNNPNNPYNKQGTRYNPTNHIEDDKNGLQHLQQQQLLPSLLIVDKLNKFVVICQAGCYMSIYYPNPFVDPLLFSPGRISTLSALVTDQLNDPTLTNNFNSGKPINLSNPNQQFHIETPHHCAHLLQSTNHDKMAMAFVGNINLRQWRNNIVWVKDCLVCYQKSKTGQNSSVFVCLTNTELTWEGRYSATRNSTALVTITLPIPTLADKNQQNNTNQNNPNSMGEMGNNNNHNHNHHPGGQNGPSSNNNNNSGSNSPSSIYNQITPFIQVPQSLLPHNAYKLVALPQPILGCLLLTSSSLLYFNLTALAYAAKMNFFDFGLQNMTTVQGVMDQTGVVLDRISISCVYAALEMQEKRLIYVGASSSGGDSSTGGDKSQDDNNDDNISTSAPRVATKNSSLLDDLDDIDLLLGTDGGGGGGGGGGGERASTAHTSNNPMIRKNQKVSPKNNNGWEEQLVNITYPYHDLINPHYLHSPTIAPFRNLINGTVSRGKGLVGPNQPFSHHNGSQPTNLKNDPSLALTPFTSGLQSSIISPFADPQNDDKERYCEFVLTTPDGQSFVLSINFPTISRISKLALGYLGVLSPVSAFIPLVIGAGVSDGVEELWLGGDDSKSSQKSSLKVKKRSVSALIFAASLWGDSKLYQFEREVTMGVVTGHNKFCNELINVYNTLLEVNEKGYPVFDQNEDQHHDVMDDLTQFILATQQQDENDLLVLPQITNAGNNDDKAVQLLRDRVGDELWDDKPNKSAAVIEQINEGKNDAFGEDIFDFNTLRQLGLKVQEEEEQRLTQFEAKQAKMTMATQAGASGSKKQPRAQQIDENNPLSSLIGFDEHHPDWKSEAAEEDEDDSDDDEDYEDEITVQQRKRRLVRPISPPWLLIERDILFGFGPLSNTTPISTSLITPHTNTTSNAMNLGTSKENLGTNGDFLPQSTLPFSNDKTQSDIISLVSLAGYAQDGKIAVYNDCINPHVIGVQRIDVAMGDFDENIAPHSTTDSKSRTTKGRGGLKSNDTTDKWSKLNDSIQLNNGELNSVEPDDVIVDVFTFVVRDIPSFIGQTLLQSGSGGIPLASKADKPNDSQFDPVLIFETDPLLSLHQLKQVIRHKHLGKRGSGVKSGEIELGKAVKQYQNSLLFLEKLTNSTQTTLNPHHTITSSSVDPSAITIVVLSTSRGTLFYSLSPNSNQNDDKGGQQQQHFASDQNDIFFSKVKSAQDRHRHAFNSQLGDMSFQWMNSHSKRQQERWSVDAYQSTLTQQQELLTQQQQSCIGMHVQDLTLILNQMGATMLKHVKAKHYHGDHLEQSIGKNDQSTTSNNKPFVRTQSLDSHSGTHLSHGYIPIRHERTLIAGPLLGLLQLWAQVTPTTINLCSNLDQVLCQIPLSKILDKCANEWDRKFGPIKDKNLTSSSIENPFTPLETHSVSFKGLQNNGTFMQTKEPITIAKAYLQDPFIILHFSNDFLCLVALDSNPLSGSWYTVSLLSFSTANGAGSNPVVAPSPASTAQTNSTTQQQSPTSLRYSADSDRITAITTCQVDLLALCPQLRLLLTSPLAHLAALDQRYGEAELSLCRKDITNRLSKQRNSKPSNQAQGSKLVNNIDDFDALFSNDDDLGLGLTKKAKSTPGAIQHGFMKLQQDNTESSKSIRGRVQQQDDQKMGQILANLPTLKLLIVSTLSFLYIIDLNTISPSGLFAIHLGMLQNLGQNAGQNGSNFNSFTDHGYVAIPLYATTTPGSFMHTLHPITDNTLQYPSKSHIASVTGQSTPNGHYFDQSVSLSVQKGHFSTEATPISELIFGNFDPNLKYSMANNNPSNNHYICLRDQHNHIIIYSLNEVFLSHLPRRLLNIVTHIRSQFSVMNPSIAHCITTNPTPTTMPTTLSVSDDHNSVISTSHFTQNNPANQMSFLDVMIEYCLALQSVQMTHQLPFNHMGLVSAVDVLKVKNRPIPSSTSAGPNETIPNSTLSQIDLTQFSTILGHILGHLPVVLRFEYSNIDNRVFLQQKQALDYLPTQLKQDLSRYSNILFDLYAKYIHQVQKKRDKHSKKVQQLAKMEQNKDTGSKTANNQGQQNSKNSSKQGGNVDNNRGDKSSLDDIDQDNKSNKKDSNDDDTIVHDSSSDGDFDASDDDGMGDTHAQLVHLDGLIADLGQFGPLFGSTDAHGIDSSSAPPQFHSTTSPNFTLLSEFDVQTTVLELLTNYSLHGDVGILEPHHFNTTLAEFRLFQSKLSLFNRLTAFSTFQHLSNAQQHQFHNHMTLDPTPITQFLHHRVENVDFNDSDRNSMSDSLTTAAPLLDHQGSSFQSDQATTRLTLTAIAKRVLGNHGNNENIPHNQNLTDLYRVLVKFNQDDEISNSFALSLLSFSNIFGIKTRQRIDELTKLVGTHHTLSKDQKPTSLQLQQQQHPYHQSQQLVSSKISLKQCYGIERVLLEHDLRQFCVKKHYFKTEILPKRLNFTSLSNQTLIPFSHNNHNGIVILGLLPQVLLFNHNNGSNLISTIPLVFHKPNPDSLTPTFNSIVRDGVNTKRAQTNHQQYTLEALPQQFPTFSQSKNFPMDLGHLEEFYGTPNSFIVSCSMLTLPHLQTNCLMFTDINNTIITCQLPPKFPSTIPSTGNTAKLITMGDKGRVGQLSTPNKSNETPAPVFNTELTLFNWFLNKQTTDAMSNNKLLTFNATTRQSRAITTKNLKYNQTIAQQKILSFLPNAAPIVPPTDAPTNLKGPLTASSKINNLHDTVARMVRYTQKTTQNGPELWSEMSNIGSNPFNFQFSTTPAALHTQASGDDLVSLEAQALITQPQIGTDLKDGDVQSPVTKRPLAMTNDDDDDDDDDGDDDDFGLGDLNTTKKAKANEPIIAPPTATAMSNSSSASNTQSTPLITFTASHTQSLFNNIITKGELTTDQSWVLFHTLLLSQSFSTPSTSCHLPTPTAPNTYISLTPVLNPNGAVTLLTSGLITSNVAPQTTTASPSPSSQTTSFIYTAPTPHGLFRFKQLRKTPTHLVIHPQTFTVCVATQTVVENGTAEIFEPFMMPVMVSSYQLDFFSLHTAQWMGVYNIPTTNPLPIEFASETKQDESVTALTLLTLYDENSQQQQERVLKTATKSKFGVWCSNGDPVTIQTHPRAFQTSTYLAVATSLRNGPLKSMKSTMVLLDLSLRNGYELTPTNTDEDGISTTNEQRRVIRKFLKVQRILEHIEHLPIHGLAVLSYDIQRPTALSYPIDDERIAWINNYANPFNHYHTHIVMACGYKVFIYRISYEQNKLIGEAFYECEFFISSIYCIKNLIICNDTLKSITMLIYDVANRNLTLFASDYNVTLPVVTSTPFVARKSLSLLTFDYQQHVSQLEFNIHDINSIKYKRLNTNFKYYLGQTVLSATAVHAGDTVPKLQLNLLSKLLDVVSKSNVFLTDEATYSPPVRRLSDNTSPRAVVIDECLSGPLKNLKSIQSPKTLSTLTGNSPNQTAFNLAAIGSVLPPAATTTMTTPVLNTVHSLVNILPSLSPSVALNNLIQSIHTQNDPSQQDTFDTLSSPLTMTQSNLPQLPKSSTGKVVGVKDASSGGIDIHQYDLKFEQLYHYLTKSKLLQMLTSTDLLLLPMFNKRQTELESLAKMTAMLEQSVGGGNIPGVGSTGEFDEESLNSYMPTAPDLSSMNDGQDNDIQPGQPQQGGQRTIILSRPAGDGTGGAGGTDSNAAANITAINPLVLFDNDDILGSFHFNAPGNDESSQVLKLFNNFSGLRSWVNLLQTNEYSRGGHSQSQVDYVTSGTSTTSLTTHGYDLALSLLSHYNQLLGAVIKGYNYAIRPPIYYDGSFVKQHFGLVRRYLAQFGTFLQLDDGLSSYFNLFAQEPYKSTLSNGFFTSLALVQKLAKSQYAHPAETGQKQAQQLHPYQGQEPVNTTQIIPTITTANYASTQHGAIVMFVPITSSQQYLLTLLADTLQQHFPFAGATVPNTFHAARTTATFLSADNHHVGKVGTDSNNPNGTNVQKRGNITKQQQNTRSMVDMSLLHMYLCLQQSQKRVIAKSIATTIQTLMDLVKYLMVAGTLHPVA